MLGQGLTRRLFLQRSMIALGAASTAGLALSPPAIGQAALAVSRQTTYAALSNLAADVVGGMPTVAQSVELFAADYAALDPSTREYVDRILDDIEQSVPGGFSEAGNSQQRATLRAWCAEGSLLVHEDVTDMGAIRRRAFATEALGWAGSPRALSNPHKAPPVVI